MAFTQNLALRSDTVLRRQQPGVVENYIGDLTFADYRRLAEKHFPFVLPMIDAERIERPAFHDYVAQMNEISWEFEDQDEGGRGIAYNQAQQNSDNRKIGTLSLFKCFSETGTEIPGPDKIILDALGGDGTLTRFFRAQKIKAPTIISGDLSGFMVNACLEQKFPCIRQSATQSLFGDSVLDGVLIAYGSHHLTGADRRNAPIEAFRTIKNGGRFVLHDFETGTPAAEWFDKVVHPFSRTTHPYPHFSRDEMFSLLKDAGFSNIRVFSLDDSFVLRGESAEDARKRAITHLYRMYDLIRLADNEADALRKLERHVRHTLGEIQIEQAPSGYTAMIPRQALVAVGTKIA